MAQPSGASYLFSGLHWRHSQAPRIDEARNDQTLRARNRPQIEKNRAIHCGSEMPPWLVDRTLRQHPDRRHRQHPSQRVLHRQALLPDGPTGRSASWSSAFRDAAACAHEPRAAIVAACAGRPLLEAACYHSLSRWGMALMTASCCRRSSAWISRTRLEDPRCRRTAAISSTHGLRYTSSSASRCLARSPCARYGSGDPRRARALARDGVRKARLAARRYVDSSLERPPEVSDRSQRRALRGRHARRCRCSRPAPLATLLPVACATRPWSPPSAFCIRVFRCMRRSPLTSWTLDEQEPWWLPVSRAASGRLQPECVPRSTHEAESRRCRASANGP